MQNWTLIQRFQSEQHKIGDIILIAATKKRRYILSFKKDDCSKSISEIFPGKTIITG